MSPARPFGAALAPNALSRPLAATVVALLVAHAGLAAWAAYRALAQQPLWNFQPADWALAALAALVACGLAQRALRRHAAGAVALAVLAAGVVLLGPGPTLAVALLLAAWFATGDFVLRRPFSRFGPVAAPTPAVALLAGVAVWIGVMALVARARIHYPPVHAAAVVLVALLGWRRLRAALDDAAERWRARDTPPLSERAWLALLGAVAILHVVVVAKPDVGYDAQAIHLTFARMLAADHRFAFDVERASVALSPLGADLAFALAWQLGGEAAARIVNLAFGAVACTIVHGVVRQAGSRECALASVALLAGMPFAFLLTASLFPDLLWIAFLLAAFAIAAAPRPADPAQDAGRWPAFAMMGAGALATRGLSLAWLVPLGIAAVLSARRDRERPALDAATAAVVALALIIAAWPYANAWVRLGDAATLSLGGAVFDSASPYHSPLLPWAPYSLIVGSARFLEGTDGALGFHGLIVIPLVALALLRPSRATLLALAVGIAFFVVAWKRQSYLRDLAPAIALAAAIGGLGLARLLRTAAARALLLAAGVALLALDLRLVYAAHHPNATPCLPCLRDASARARYVETYAPMRVVAEWLERELPSARVGFLVVNAPTPAGYTGRSRSANALDPRFYEGIVQAQSAEDVLAVVKRFRVTHVVVPKEDRDASPAIRSFVARHAAPLHAVGDSVVARVEETGRP